MFVKKFQKIPKIVNAIMKAILILPIEKLRGMLRKDGYYFRMYKGKQIVQRCPNRREHIKTANEQANQELFIAKYRKSKPASDAGLINEENT